MPRWFEVNSRSETGEPGRTRGGIIAVALECTGVSNNKAHKKARAPQQQHQQRQVTVGFDAAFVEGFAECILAARFLNNAPAHPETRNRAHDG